MSKCSYWLTRLSLVCFLCLLGASMQAQDSTDRYEFKKVWETNDFDYNNRVMIDKYDSLRSTFISLGLAAFVAGMGAYALTLDSHQEPKLKDYLLSGACGILASLPFVAIAWYYNSKSKKLQLRADIYQAYYQDPFLSETPTINLRLRFAF